MLFIFTIFIIFVGAYLNSKEEISDRLKKDTTKIKSSHNQLRKELKGLTMFIFHNASAKEVTLYQNPHQYGIENGWQFSVAQDAFAVNGSKCIIVRFLLNGNIDVDKSIVLQINKEIFDKKEFKSDEVTLQHTGSLHKFFLLNHSDTIVFKLVL